MLQQRIADPLAVQILDGRIENGERVQVDAVRGELVAQQKGPDSAIRPFLFANRDHGERILRYERLLLPPLLAILPLHADASILESAVLPAPLPLWGRVQVPAQPVPAMPGMPPSPHQLAFCRTDFFFAGTPGAVGSPLRAVHAQTAKVVRLAWRASPRPPLAPTRVGYTEIGKCRFPVRGSPTLDRALRVIPKSADSRYPSK